VTETGLGTTLAHATGAAAGVLRVAGIQMTAAASVEPNLATAARLLEQAQAAGARLAVLPEFFCLLGRRETDKVDAGEPDGDGPIQRFLSERARALQLWLVGGSLPLKSPDPRRVYNASLTFAPDGSRVARYDKIHLFGLNRPGEPAFDESATIVAGRTPVVFDVPARERRWRIGMSICYDVRFPEMYRVLAPVDLILVPSVFTYVTGHAHWETLLRSRAIENQCYVLAPAQGGRHENGRRSWGHSLLIDPWGEIISVLPEGEGIVVGELDAARLAEVRANLPALTHRTL
jgi:deaminated glutathione amidase